MFIWKARLDYLRRATTALGLVRCTVRVKWFAV